MNIKQLENKIVKALDQEIDMANNVGTFHVYENENNYYDPNVELLELKRFIKKCFKKHREGKQWKNIL